MESKTLDEALYELAARGALAASGIPQDAEKIVGAAKQAILDAIERAGAERVVSEVVMNGTAKKIVENTGLLSEAKLLQELGLSKPVEPQKEDYVA